MDDDTKTMIKIVLFILFMILFILLLVWLFSGDNKEDDKEPDEKEPDEKKPDKCKNVDCGSNGECIDGDCSCFHHWYGNKCEYERDHYEREEYRYCKNRDCPSNKEVKRDRMCLKGDCTEHECCKYKHHDKCEDIDCGEHGDCVDGECICKDGYTGHRCEIMPAILNKYTIGTNIIDDKVIPCNDNCICDIETDTCLKECRENEDCLYVSNEYNLDDPISAKCVSSNGKFICPLGQTICDTENEVNITRLCDPYNQDCRSVNGETDIKCSDKKAPWIGYDENNKYQVTTTPNKNSCWSKI